jgi:hypothetical protein
MGCHVTQPLGFDRSSSDSWDHRTVTVSLSGAPSGACSDSARAVRALFTHYSPFADDRWYSSRCSAWHTGQSSGTPDSPVNNSGVALQKPEAVQFKVDLLGAPDSPVRQTRAAFGWFCSFIFEPYLGLFIGLC